MSDLKVGDTIWRYDGNRRVYEKTDGLRSKLVYRGHWHQVEILSETSRSWITSHWNEKAPKRGEHRGYAFTDQELDDACYVHEHANKISEQVRRLNDAATLRAVAEAIGYEENK